MANRGSRFSFGGSASSMRESLGMPLRREVGGGADHWGNITTGRPTSSATQKGKKPKQQASRRQTYVSRPSSSVQQQRPSIATSSRISASSRASAGRSSLYGAPSTLKKDHRALSDKAFQQDMVKKMIRFLADNHYPKTLTTANLSPPSSREFVQIFNFLLELIDDSLPINPVSMVDELPLVLKMLGYPFNVSKNHLLNVGSPHSWPILLGAISWLRECCSVSDNTKKILFGGSEDGFGDDENDEKIAAEFAIEETMYRTYMQYGPDSREYQSLVMDRKKYAAAQCEQIQSDIDKLSLENTEITSRVEDLSRSSLSALQQEAQQNEMDYVGLVNHLEEEVMPAIRDVEGLNAQADSRTSELEMQIEASDGKLRELEEQVRCQPMSAMDARALHKSVQDAEDDLDRKRKQYHDTTARISDLQMQHNKSLQRINSEVQLVNSKLVRLAALYPDVASLSLLDYDTSKRADPEVLHKLIAHAKQLRDSVQTVHREVANSIHELEGQILSTEAAKSTLHTELVRKELEVENVRHNLSCTREALEKKRKQNEEAMKTSLADRLALENSLRGMQQKLQTEPAQKKRYQSLKQSCELEQKQMLKTLKEENSAMQELVIDVTRVIEILRDQEVSVRKEVAELVNMYKEVKVPTVSPEVLSPSTNVC